METITRRLIKPEDLNPANKLFGGKLLQWIDEVGVIYVYGKFNETRLVTTEMRDVYFRCSPSSGDIIEFTGEIIEERKASVWIRVRVKNVTVESKEVIDCSLRFAFLDRMRGKSEN